MRKVVIAGGTGFLGPHLVAHVELMDWTVYILRRGVDGWNGRDRGQWEAHLKDAEAVVNLAGAPITLPWTAENRKLIVDSRVLPTAVIGSAVAESSVKVWINASATGFYGNRSDEILTETSPQGQGFLAEVCESWENSFFGALPTNVRGIALRTGIVLGKEGGALALLSKLAHLGLGGTTGNGRQWMPWIHVHDHVRMIVFALESGVSGPLNAVGPNPTTNHDFMASLRGVIRVPFGIPAPAFGLEAVSKLGGPHPSIALDSTRAIPEKATSTGFEFKFETLEPALADCLGAS